jgi:Domain of unknown function (DUF5122) beta-propeller
MTDRSDITGRRNRLRLGRRSALAAVVAGAVLALTAAPASAAGNLPATAPLDLWGVDGTANAVVVSGSTAYVGGSFANAVRFTQSASRANMMALTLGTPKPVDSLSAFEAPTNGAVRALAVDSTWLYLGGDFTAVRGTMRAHVARVNRTSGALDTTWNVTTDTTVRDMVLVGNTLYLVGDFTKVNGVARKRAAAVSTADTGSLDANFHPSLTNKVYAVAAGAGRIFLGGNFTTVNGTARSFMAAVDANGQLTGSAFNSINDVVLDLSVAGTQVFAAADGGFNSVAAWNVSGGAMTWRNRANGDVQAVVYARGNAYFGFHDGFSINGVPDTSLRLLAADAGSGAITPFAPQSSGNVGVLALSSDGPYLAAVGKFPKMGGVSVKSVAVFVCAAPSCNPAAP